MPEVLYLKGSETAPFPPTENHPRTPNPILFHQTEIMESISVFFMLEGHCHHLIVKIQNIIVLLKVP